MTDQADKQLEHERNEALRQYRAAQRLIRIKKSRDSLLDFTHLTMPDPADADDPDRSLYVPAKHHKVVAAALEEAEAGRLPRLIVTLPPQHGKAIKNNSLVLTPSGWVLHGSLEQGDTVFHPSGKSVKVLAASQETPVGFEVEFTNGEVVTCHANHEWEVYDRRRNRWRVVETQDMLKDHWIGEKGKRGGRARWQLPPVEMLRFRKKNLPMNPYVLGVWLGDGTVGAPVLTNSEEDALVFQEEFARAGYRCTHVYVYLDHGTHRSSFYKTRLIAALRKTGVLENKHVPEIYLRGSKEQRLELLAGLIDTDGHIESERTGRCRFVTTTPALKDAVFDLAASLGFRPGVTSVPAQISSSGVNGNHEVFTVAFQPSEDLPTRIPRKQVHVEALRRRVSVRDVREVDPVPGKCIQVDSPDGMYLVGRNLVPTHNSELVTRRFPAWAIGRDPSRNIIMATYSGEFAKDFGRDVREIIQSATYRQIFPRFGLRKGGAAANRFDTIYQGSGKFVGRGEALTGRGGNILLLDDPLKDAEEADSNAIRNQAWAWFTKVFMTRQRPGAVIVIVMTRWHEDDIVGRLTDPQNKHYSIEEARTWKIINLAAEARPGDPLGRPEGAPLWPERYNLDFLHAQKRLDPRAYSALYQQQPSPEDGDLITKDMIKTYRRNELPSIDDLRIYAASDHATTKEQRNDPNCIVIVGIDRDSRMWVLDCYWKRVETDEMVEQMLQKMKLWNPIVWWAGRDHITKSIGPFLFQRMREEQIYIHLEPISEVGDKVKKARSIIARMSMGMVLLPSEAPWFDDARSEMLKFPTGKHDDFVDAMGFIGRGLPRLTGPGRKPTGPKIPEVGTLAWVKYAGQQAEEQQRLQKSLAGW